MRNSDSKLLLLVGALCIIVLLVVGFGFQVTKLVVNLGIIGVHLEPSIPSPSVVVSQPQVVWWGPVVGHNAGICLNSDSCEDFVPWAMLKEEVEQKLLPQVADLPHGSMVRLRDSEGKQDLIMEVVNSSGVVVAHAWFGYNPDGWGHDGLVRIGTPYAPSTILGTFRRYSDGSYREK